jgi:hypothetical protein
MTRASIPSILRAVEKLKEALAVARPAKGGGVRQSPAICLARARKAQCHPEDPGSLGKPSSLPPDTRPMPWRLIREAAQQTCRTCEVLAETLASVSEPAWALVAHLASETCGDCALADIGSACSTCPQVDLLRRLVRQTRRERMNAAPA